jgi:hypothetical protein
VPAAWRSISSAYVVCTDDHTIHPDDQRDMAMQASEVHELDSSHSPFFSHPDELAAIIASYACRSAPLAQDRRARLEIAES